MNKTKTKAKKAAAEKKRRSKGFQDLGTLFDKYEMGQPGKYISQEFQDFGYRLALDLDDLKYKSLYIKLAKNEDRGLLEAARRFVIDADHARSKGKLFMWKLKELKKEKLERLKE
jgi:hypothetical protein